MKKKVLSLILALCLLFSLFPAIVYAEGETCEISIYSYSSDIGFVLEATRTELLGTEITEAAEAREGYTFLGWYSVTETDEAGFPSAYGEMLTALNGYTITVCEDLVLAVVYELENFPPKGTTKENGDNEVTEDSSGEDENSDDEADPDDEEFAEEVETVGSTETTEDQNTQPVRVEFICEPEKAIVTVYDPEKIDENGEPTAIEPEEDGSWLLLPGTYLYNVEAEGYVAEKQVGFEAKSSEENHEQKLEIKLENKPEVKTRAAVKSANTTVGLITSFSESYRNGPYYIELLKKKEEFSSDLATNVVMVANSQEGYTGSSNPSNRSGVVTESAGNYTEYNLWYHNQDATNHASYCNLFVSWCLHAAGVSESVAPKNPFYITSTAYGNWKDCGAEVYSWKDYMAGLYTPTPGDILLYETSSSSGVSGSSLSGTHSEHVGIITGYDPNTKKITTIEGATSGYKVAPKSRTPRESDGYAGYQNSSGKNRYYYAFIHPVYSGTSSQPTEPYLTISGETYPTGNLPLNKGFSLKGVISSYPNLTNVTARIINTATGQVVTGFDYSVNPNSTTYNIQSGGIDSAFKFATLPAGSYRYLVSAENDNICKILISSYFTMSGTSAHTHDKGTYLFYEAAHPHRNAYKCSICGETWVDMESSNYVSTCETCNPPNPVAPNAPSVSVSGQSVTVSWNNVANETGYNVYLVQAPWGWDDIKYSISAGANTTTYTFDNVAVGDYAAFVIARPNADSVQSGWTSFSVAAPVQYSIFDLNGKLDGVLGGDIESYGTVDIYMNGSLVGSSVNDYCDSWPVGTQYEIKNIRTADGCQYDGTYSGSLSGTVGTERTEVWLSFSTCRYVLDLNGKLDDILGGSIDDCGTCDVYINGSLAAENASDYCTDWPYGTSYEIKNIRIADGYSYDGISSTRYDDLIPGTRTGTLNQNTSVRLVFHTCPTDIDERPEPFVFNGHTYYFFTTPLNWWDAESVCESMGGHLATITGAAENEALETLANGSDFWLGGTDRDSEGTWSWTTGESFSYTDWGEGQPDNASNPEEGGENYLHYSGGAGHWNDNTGTPTYPFICEVDSAADPVAEPPVVTLSSASVVFDGLIRIKYYLTVPEELLADPDATVRFYKGEEEVARAPLSDGVAQTGDHAGQTAYYYDTVAKEINDIITLQVLDGSGEPVTLLSTGGTDYTAGFVYSVKTYAENKQQNGTTQKMRDLAKSLEDYGNAAQLYFEPGKAVGAAVSEAVKAVGETQLLPYALSTSGTKPAGVTGASISVVFEADNSLRIYFKFDGSKDPDSYACTIDGVGQTLATRSTDGARYLTVTNIAAKDLGQMYDFAISDGSDTYTVTACALSYALTSVRNGTEARKDLGRALYLYNEAASAYFT